MRIDSSGNVGVGTTSAVSTLNLVRPADTANYIYMLRSGQIEATMGFSATEGRFYIGTGSTVIGTYGVYQNNTGNSWISVSDERKKDIIEPITGAVEKVSGLRAVIGKYKHDVESKRRSFLVAQDVLAVFPEAVDAENAEDLGLSYTDMVPLLVAAIQELKAIVDTQAARITALEAA
jgi:hypothetical protein